jgi:hypothetical protein
MRFGASRSTGHPERFPMKDRPLLFRLAVALRINADPNLPKGASGFSVP